MVEPSIKKGKKPRVWAVGGGKGGVGKSVLSALLAYWLARMGHKTVLVDADLGGANLHTLLGIKIPPRTMNDFISRKYDTLEEVCIDVEENLRLISGASEVLSLANPLFVQKVKIIQNVYRLDCDYVVLDLGAGASFNVLDFFLVSHRKLVILTPQPTAIQNAYGFIRNAVYRRLCQLVRQQPSLDALVKAAMDPKNDLKMRTVKELLKAIEESEGPQTADALREELSKIQPAIMTNMAKEDKDKNAGKIVQLVSKKYLTIQCADMGGVAFDKQIEKTLLGMVPLTTLDSSSEALASVYNIAAELVSDGRQTSQVEARRAG